MKDNIIKVKKNNYILEYISYPEIDPEHIISNLDNPKYFYDLDSFFSIIVFNTINNEYTMISDIFNTFRIYHSPYMVKPSFSIPKSVKKKISEKSLSYFLKYRYIPAPLTFFENVFTLTPGTIMRSKDGIIKPIYIHKHVFQERCIELQEFSEKTENIFVSFFKKLNSYNCSLFLSGGVDSSMIGYYAKKVFHNITALSCIFPGEIFDEKNFSDKVCKEIGLNKKNSVLNPEDYISFWEKMPDYFEQPVSTHTGPAYYKMINNTENKIILTGYGGDEIFGGDIKYSQALKNEKFKTYLKSMNIDLQISDARDFFYRSISFYETGYRLKKQNSCVLNEFIDFNLTYWQCDYENYIMNSFMRNSNKVILSPMLIPSFVKMVNSLSNSHKIDGSLNRVIWRKNVSKIFGDKFAWRQSQGFSAPLNRMFKDDLWEYVQQNIKDIKKRKLLNMEHLNQKIDHFNSGGNAYNNILLLIILENYLKHYEDIIYIS